MTSGERKFETGTRKLIATAVVVLLAAVAVAACVGDEDGSGTRADLPQGSEPVDLDPADFTTRIDTPYRPMPVGSRRVYLGDGHRRYGGARRGQGHPEDEEDR